MISKYVYANKPHYSHAVKENL